MSQQALKFRAGQRVTVRRTTGLGAPAGQYRIVGALPQAGGPAHYRVKSDVEQFERVIAESNLSEADY